MYLNIAEQSALIGIFTSQGLSRKGAISLVTSMCHTERHHGTKFLVDRLKNYRSYLFGNKPVGFSIHKDGSPKGHFRQVIRPNMSRREKIRADRILRVYGRWEAGTGTRKDYSVFNESLRKDSSTPEQVEKVSIDPLLLRLANRLEPSFNLSLPLSSRKRVPFVGKVEGDILPFDHLRLLWKYTPNLFEKYREFFADHLVAVGDIIDEQWFIDLFEKPDPRNDVMGKIICLTKDRGLKRRFIANPHRFLQLMTSRLQNACELFLKALPESCVYDQDSSHLWVKEQIEKGRFLYSLDLSAATDRFPFSLQEQVIRDLFPALTDDIDLWKDIVKGKWLSPFGDLISYEVGQPMGTAPSFAAFTVTHALLVRSIGGNPDNFRILGDDIVISDPSLSDSYQRKLAELGVKISLTKSLLHQKKAEFAGRTIDRYGPWPSYKATPLDLHKDPMGYYRQYGLQAEKLIPQAYRKRLTLVAQLPNIGVERLYDPSLLESISFDLLAKLYGIPNGQYTSFTEGKQLAAILKAKPSVEGGPRDNVVFFGSWGSNNDPRLTDHVNANLKGLDIYDVRSPHIVEWETHLERTQLPFEFKESSVQLPLYRCLEIADELLGTN